MTDQERLNLSLGDPPAALVRRFNHVPRGWLWLLLLGQLAILLGLGIVRARPQLSPAGPGGGQPSTADAAALKAVAAALEEKGLEAEAAGAWEDYLRREPQAADRAEILYRVGKLRIEAEQYAPAAAALVRAEQAAGDNKDLKGKIGPLVVECLSRLGRYGEVGRELARRVETGGGADRGKAKVVATLAGQPLTEADLDRLAERRVDSLLAMQGAAGDEARRQAVLQQLSAPQARKQLLQELLQTELFSRRARELHLDQEEAFRQARDQIVQGLLAERFLAKEMGKIQPTPVDLESYYQAHAAQYQEPEALQAVIIPLGPGEDPAAILAKIKSSGDFTKLAAVRRPKGAADEPARRLVRKQEDPLLGKIDTLFELGEGQWTKTPLAQGNDRFLVLVQKKIPPRTPPLEEVESRVRGDYVMRKQQEWAEKMLGELMMRYEVRIVPPEPPAKDSAPPAQGGKSAK